MLTCCGALKETVCLRPGLERPLLLPEEARDQGGSPLGDHGAAELQPHLPFLKSGLTQPHYPRMSKLQLRQLTSPAQGPRE